MTVEEIHRNHFAFFPHAHRLLKPGGRLTCYSDEARELSPEHRGALVAAGFLPEGIDFEVCPVEPPDGCEYWNQPTIVVPIVTRLFVG